MERVIILMAQNRLIELLLSAQALKQIRSRIEWASAGDY